MERHRGAGENRVRRGTIAVLQGEASGRDGGFSGIRGGTREGGVARAELEHTARAGNRAGQSRVGGLIEDDQAVIDDRADGPEAAGDLERTRDGLCVDVGTSAGLGRGRKPERTAEGAEAGQRGLGGEIDPSDAITTATGRGRQTHVISDARIGRHVLPQQVRDDIGRSVRMR